MDIKTYYNASSVTIDKAKWSSNGIAGFALVLGQVDSVTIDQTKTFYTNVMPTGAEQSGGTAADYIAWLNRMFDTAKTLAAQQQGITLVKVSEPLADVSESSTAVVTFPQFYAQIANKQYLFADWQVKDVMLNSITGADCVGLAADFVDTNAVNPIQTQGQQDARLLLNIGN